MLERRSDSLGGGEPGKQLRADGTDDGTHVHQLCLDVAVDQRFQVGDPVAEAVNALDRVFQLARRSFEVRECFVEGFIVPSDMAARMSA